MENETKSNQLLSYLPLLTLAAFAYGVINLGIYYAFFDFNIFEYIELDELFPLVIKDTIVFLSIMGPLLVCLYRFSPSYIIAKIESGNKWSFKTSRMVFIAIASFSTTAWIDYHQHKITFTGFLIVSVPAFTLFLIRYLPQWLFGLYEKIKNIIDTRNLMIITQLTIILIGGAVFTGLRNHLIVEDWRVNEKVSLVLNTKQQVSCSKQYYYIGRTKAGFFYYDTKRDQVDIYPTSVVSLISVKDH